VALAQQPVAGSRPFGNLMKHGQLTVVTAARNSGSGALREL
jgi:hypothetical protein